MSRMELSFSAFMYAICYGLAAVAIWRAGRPFPVLMGFFLLEIPYSFARSWQFNRSFNLAMVLLSLVACGEGYWLCVRRDAGRKLWAILSCSSLAVIGAILTSSQMQVSVLSVRHASLVMSSIFLAVLVGLDWIQPLCCTSIERLNLRLLAIWQAAVMACSITYDLYPDGRTWRRIEAAFLVILAMIALTYVTSLRSLFVSGRDGRLVVRRFVLRRS